MGGSVRLEFQDQFLVRSGRVGWKKGVTRGGICSFRGTLISSDF